MNPGGVNPGSGTTPVYRFYNKRNGSHFYTSSEAEKHSVVEELSKTYSLDGVAYHVLASYPTPLYRFYNKTNGSHFYTASEAEKSRVMEQAVQDLLVRRPRVQRVRRPGARLGAGLPLLQHQERQPLLHGV